MGQIVNAGKVTTIVNLQAIQTTAQNSSLSQDGSIASTPLADGEIWLVDSTNSRSGDGSGKYDSFITGDGTSTASQLLPATKIDNEITIDNSVIQGSTNAVSGGAVKTALDTKVDENREYNLSSFSGLGKKTLKKNIQTIDNVEKNILTTAMFPDANTIYVIYYDYDLNGGTVTIPTGCTLCFDGGSFSNGTLTGDETIIDASNYRIFNGITFAGTFIGALNATWVGAKARDNTHDNGAVLQAWLSSYCDTFKVIDWPTDVYYFLTPAAMSGDKRYKSIVGNNSTFNVLIPDVEGAGQYFLTITGENFTISDVLITNARTTTIETTSYSIAKTRGILFNYAQCFSLSCVTIRYFDVGIELIDVWYGGFPGNCALYENRIGILGTKGTSTEINTIDFRNVRFRGISNERARACWPQNDGESEDAYNLRVASCGIDFHVVTNNCKFTGMTIEGFEYGIRFNNNPRSSSNSTLNALVNINECYFEANRVYDIYIGEGYVINPNNHTKRLYMLATVKITGCLFHTLKEIYLDNAYAQINGCYQSPTVTLAHTYRDSYLWCDGNVSCTSRNVEYITSKHFVYSRTGQNQAVSDCFRTDLERTTGGRKSTWVDQRQQALSTSYSSADRNLVNIYNERNIGMYPSAKMQNFIQPLRLFRGGDYDFYAEVYSGGSYRKAICHYSTALRVLNKYPDAIPLYEFLRRWDAGTAYTGKVDNLFYFDITSNPTTGIITNESGNVVGYSKTAVINDNMPSSDTWSLVNMDVLCLVRKSYSYTKFYCDLVQCGRSYDEILPNADPGGNTAANKVRSFINKDYVAPRVNAIVYNSSEQKYEIYNGFEWVEMTTRLGRYTYKERGKSIAERASMADFPGQTFFNEATGITYTFWVNSSHTNYGWRTSIGSVDSLDNPNGYNATSNPVEYSTELSYGECVNYEGKIYKWNGIRLVKIAADSVLPSGYTELEYVESVGSGGYIDTGLVPSDDFGFSIVLSRENITDDNLLNGCRETSGDTRCSVGVNQNQIYIGWGGVPNGRFVMASDAFRTINVNLYNNRKYNVGNQATKTISDTLPTITKSFYLFGCNSYSSQYAVLQKIKSAIFTRDDELIAQFVPCIDPNNVVGMYDIVRNQFFGSANGNGLVAGPET